MGLFGTKKKESEALRLLKDTRNLEPNMKTFLEYLKPQDERRTNPHHNAPRKLLERTKNILEDVQKNKYDHFPIVVHFDGKLYHIHGIESMARLRALRSANKSSVRLAIHH